MEKDVDLHGSGDEVRRLSWRLWLSSAALLCCILMMTNLVVQAQATAPVIERHAPHRSGPAN